jgi:hypothetical protein
VLFEDGTGDGEPDKVKSLQDVFRRNRKELEHVIAILTRAIDLPQIEDPTNLFAIQSKLSETPDLHVRSRFEGNRGVDASFLEGHGDAPDARH